MDHPGTDPLAALTGLTSLNYGNNDPGQEDAVWALAQLTRLRRLKLKHPSTFSDGLLTQLSALSRLTCLKIEGDGFVAVPPHVARVTVSSAKLMMHLHDARASDLPSLCSALQS